MLFNSPTFLFLFLPAFWLAHLIVPRRGRNAVLLAASLIFYAWGEPVFVLALMASTLVNGLLARHIDRANRSGQPEGEKIALVLAVVFNVGFLSVFKYAGFLVETLNRVAGLDVPVPAIPLPLGISFFTFKAMSYVFDVHRRRTPAQRSFGRLLLYVAIFPQLIAGPIERYGDFEPQFENRPVTLSGTAAGVRRFIIGLAKKLLLAGPMGLAADRVFNAAAAQAGGAPGSIDLSVAWIGALAYAAQIYFDFSGYSDMAIGLGRMFGFTFRENFLYPYTATSLQDFWRRWHISLSTWFREYVYIPLGGNRKGRGRAAVNRIIVFFLTGLWHGANWTFVVWGLYHGVFLMLESYRIIRLDRLPRLARTAYTLLLAVCGFVIFRAETLTQAFAVLRAMAWGWQRTPAAQALLMELLSPGLVMAMLAGIIAATPIAPWLRTRFGHMPRLRALGEPAGYAGSLALLGLCVLAMSASTYNPFIYARF